jgi:DNA polymerase-1
MPQDEAEFFLAKFFARYSGIPKLRQEFWGMALRQNCHFQNLWGRPRYIPGMASPVEYEREKAKRQAIGSLIQGTAAELTKESMIRIWQWFKSENIPAQICTTIHDEIQIDTPIEYIDRVVAASKHYFQHYPEFEPIPILVDGAYSVTNWAEKKKLPG